MPGRPAVYYEAVEPGGTARLPGADSLVSSEWRRSCCARVTPAGDRSQGRCIYVVDGWYLLRAGTAGVVM